jgi:pimeloyl-ACP methyl ester carboxylesterase
MSATFAASRIKCVVVPLGGLPEVLPVTSGSRGGLCGPAAASICTEVRWRKRVNTLANVPARSTRRPDIAALDQRTGQVSSMTTNVDVQIHRVTTEGDTLCYEVRGEGKPLLMIAGGGGDAWWYSSVADILADEYKVITYDRRTNCRSTMNEPQNFEISQQSRDTIAILHAAGESSAFVFGNSGGAIIALFSRPGSAPHSLSLDQR